MLKDKYVLGAGTMVAVTLVAGAFLSSVNVSADDTAIDNVAVTVPVSCSMEGTGMSSHNANIVNGTYQADIGTTTMKAFCNDTNGFAIYAIGYTDNEYGKTVLTNTTLGSTADIATGTATSGNTSNWAMKLATDGTATYALILDNSFNAYHTVPSSYTKVAHRDNATDIGTNATGSTLTTTYAAFMAQTQPAGTYTGQVKYTLVHPSNETPVTPLSKSDCPANSICYAPNAYDVVGVMIAESDNPALTPIAASTQAGQQTRGRNVSNNIINITSNTMFELIAPNYSRQNYGFAGWSTDFEANENSTIYGPNESIDVGDVSTNGLILYPVWVASSGVIQNWSGCNSLETAPTTGGRASISSVTALTDSRDNSVYAVARLADGKCWMIENLRLESENSNIESLAQGFGDDTANNHGKFIGLAESENSNFTTTIPTMANNAANSIYSADDFTIININTGDTSYGRIPRYNNNNTNRNLSPSYRGTGYAEYYQWYGYGNYYNWPATIANTAYFASNNSSVTNTSICPTGWHIPTGGSVTTTVNVTENLSTWREFYNLGNAVMGVVANDSAPGANAYYNNSTTNASGDIAKQAFRKFPYNFVYSGYFSADYSALGRGTSSNYWSSTAKTNVSSYSFYLLNTNVGVYPGTDDDSKYIGQSIRCIAD